MQINGYSKTYRKISEKHRKRRVYYTNKSCIQNISEKKNLILVSTEAKSYTLLILI